MDPLFHLLVANVDGPVVPVFLTGIHTEDLDLPKGVNRIGNGILKALTDVADAADPLSLITFGGLGKKLSGRDRAFACDREVREREARKARGSGIAYLWEAVAKQFAR